MSEPLTTRGPARRAQAPEQPARGPQNGAAPPASAAEAAAQRAAPAWRMDVTLLTGGFDRPYTFGLATALAEAGVSVEIVGGDQLDCPEYHSNPNIRFLNLRGDQTARVSPAVKVRRVLRYYARLLHYAAAAKPKIFHILWNNKFQAFDRTLLMLFYKALGKKLIVTAHNINQAARDGHDSAWNRLTLGIQYRLADRVFVHNDGMRHRLCRQFGVRPAKVAVIPFGINNDAPNTSLTRERARAKLGLAPEDRALLFFGSIRPYKGLENLIRAFAILAPCDSRYRLLIAGAPHFGDEQYLEQIKGEIQRCGLAGRILSRFEFIPDAETEIYCKAADLMVLPYNDISWSGVLILGYTFGLPAVVTDVGALREEVLGGQTGFVCPPRDPNALAAAIEGALERQPGESAPGPGLWDRWQIQAWTARRYGWIAAAKAAVGQYRGLIPAPQFDPAATRDGVRAGTATRPRGGRQ
jgi:glycosyltransferase involved in cell wall biosynthesis